MNDGQNIQCHIFVVRLCDIMITTFFALALQSISSLGLVQSLKFLKLRLYNLYDFK